MRIRIRTEGRKAIGCTSTSEGIGERGRFDVCDATAPEGFAGLIGLHPWMDLCIQSRGMVGDGWGNHIWCL